MKLVRLLVAAVMLAAGAHRAEAGVGMLGWKGKIIDDSTRYWNSVDGSSDDNAASTVTSAGKICDLVAHCDATVSGTLTLYKNGIATALTLTITAGTDGADHNAAHCVTVAAGDTTSMQAVGSSGTTDCKAAALVTNTDGSPHTPTRATATWSWAR